MNIELFPHNEKGYKKLIEYLKISNLASVDHATGTGKSFIILKYLYENKDKKILYMTPTYPIFNQLINEHLEDLGIKYSDFACLDNIIYPNILSHLAEDIAKKYDVFVLDEYHRCGARKWGKWIKELIKIIIEKYPEKKIIGLTATNIRYLDQERDMNMELFDGNCASKLTLDEAILNGLLPSPTYISTYSAVGNVINKIEKKIAKKIRYKKDQEKYLEAIKNIKNNIKNRETLDDEFKLPKENGKYIVFCSTIKDIKENQKFIQNKYKNKNLTFFQVHSNQSHEVNDKNIKTFRNSEGTNSFMFVVDILNEGIHVKDIDGIFMMRKTTSPIIFFQQLGRLLSFSGKNRDLVVWDLVDNLRNHPVIYTLVDNVVKEAKKRIITDPDNKERYERILKNFKIVDHTANSLTKINELVKELDEINSEQMTIDSVVRILSDPNYPDIAEKIKAQSDIFTFYKYVSYEQFTFIKNLDIALPKELKCSEEEFLQKLGGYKNIKEKETNENLAVLQKFEQFVNEHGRLPSVITDSLEERELAININIIKSDMPSSIKSKYSRIRNLVIAIPAFDRAFYGFRVSKSHHNEIIKGCEYCQENNIEISSNLKRFLKNSASEYMNPVFSFYFDALSCPSYDAKEAYYESRDAAKRELMTEKFEKLEQEKLERLEPFLEELIAFISENYRYPNYSDGDIYKEYSKLRNLIIKLGHKNNIDIILKAKKTEMMEKISSQTLKNVLKFMEENNGDLPAINSFIKEEANLAMELKKYNSRVSAQERNFIKNQRIELKRINNDHFLDDYISFVRQNYRYPIGVVSSTEEQFLHLRFLRNEPYFTKDELITLKNLKKELGENNLIANTYLARTRLNKVKEKENVIIELKTFIANNYGTFPNVDSTDPNERELAQRYIKIKNDFTEEEQNDLISYQNSVKAKYDFDIVEEYVNFILKNERYPIANLEDEAEKVLFELYNKNIAFFTEEEKAKITQAVEKIGKEVLFKNTVESYGQKKS